jgi:arginyl-tRNA--protein-N-Asp/Glu arginylyltransferase
MSKLQNIVASHACKEAIWLKGLLGEFGRMQNKVKVFCDNQSVIHLARNPAYHNKTKHIYDKYHFVREVVDEEKVALEKVHTKVNFADMFTKPVLLEKLR